MAVDNKELEAKNNGLSFRGEKETPSPMELMVKKQGKKTVIKATTNV